MALEIDDSVARHPGSYPFLLVDKVLGMDSGVRAVGLRNVTANDVLLAGQGRKPKTMRRGLSRDIAAGMTLQGPHRDDIAFSLNDMPAAGFASRAQQRTIALALRLAEAQLLSSRRGEAPVLLLDDILSEMDADRCRSVIDTISTYDQLLVTTTDAGRFPRQFLDDAAVFSVAAGTVAPLSEPAYR